MVKELLGVIRHSSTSVHSNLVTWQLVTTAVWGCEYLQPGFWMTASMYSLICSGVSKYRS